MKLSIEELKLLKASALGAAESYKNSNMFFTFVFGIVLGILTGSNSLSFLKMDTSNSVFNIILFFYLFLGILIVIRMFLRIVSGVTVIKEVIDICIDEKSAIKANDISQSTQQ
ncbi:hypothetical protein LSG31_04215 [Fodinisporobacter ferrooxydans]|uniref:Uncharacterized protein n=1 Tax=Fodinisporobacter ferrooxydans TaxID=2901836 RepID=A0ABY4CLT7_9BACL|nr:hypothetical protein LSG31_04215 [Alicyclobacillaceae bacterium MYW30-H2]